MSKKFWLILFIFGYVIGYVFSQYQLNNLPQVIGKRAFYITTDKKPVDDKGKELKQEEDFFFHATVTFIKNNKFAAAAHWFDGVASGYGYFKEPSVANDEMIIRASDAKMLITKISTLGLFGKITPKFSEAGIPVEAGKPKPGPAVILLSGEVGQAPVFAKAIIWPAWIKSDEELFILQVLDNDFTPQGSSGSPVVQMQNGKLKLIGAHAYGLNNLSASVPAGLMIKECDKIE